MNKACRTAVALCAALLSTPALAHVGAHHAEGFLHGLAHPFTGLDHLLALLAIGAWAAGQGRRPAQALTTACLLGLTAGVGIGLAGAGVPLLEPGIALSVVLFASLVALGTRLGRLSGALLVGGFALLHGVAHGQGITADTALVSYLAGLLAGSAALLAVGALARLALEGFAPRRAPAALGVLGGGAALAGAWLAALA